MGVRHDIGVWLDIEDIGRDGKTKLLTKDHVWVAKRELESRGYYVPACTQVPGTGRICPEVSLLWPGSATYEYQIATVKTIPDPLKSLCC